MFDFPGMHSLRFAFVSIDLLKPRNYFTYQQVQYSKILRGSHTTLMCSVRISEQTATFSLHNISRLVLYNRGGECLLRGTD